MKTVYHEAMHPLGNLGLKISMAALESPHIPMHWHDAMEILFCLNGEVTIQIDHEAFLLSRNQLVVFDSKEMHSIQSASPLYMFLCIHVDKKQMALYCPDLEFTTSNVSHCRWITPSQQNTLRSVSLPVTSPVPVLKKKAPAPCARMVSLF